MEIVQINSDGGIGKEKLFSILYEIESQWHPSMADDIVGLRQYAEKIYDNAVVFGAVINKKIVGIAAVYANDITTGCAYLTYIALLEECLHEGIGAMLLSKVEELVDLKKMRQLVLEVDKCNERAVNFYKKNGFKKYKNVYLNHMYMIKFLI